MPETDISKPSAIVGSLQCPYKLCIAGGGPSGTSILIRAIRIGVCDELCDFEYPPSSSLLRKSEGNPVDEPILGGVCIIDKGTAEKFGGGKLSEYQINSNTWANKFVTNITNDKLDVTPSESVKDTVLGKLKSMPIAIEVESYGTKNVPLCTVGALLCDVGKMISTQIAKFKSSSAVLTETTVKEIHRIQTKTFSGWRVVISKVSSRGTEVLSDVYCKDLVLCTGGIQRLPTLPNPQHSNKLMTSDFVCTTEGINEVRRRLLQHYSSVGHSAFHNGNAKVAIVGGSHSAFSAAWMCLHKIVFPEHVVNPRSLSLSTHLPSSPTSKSVKLLNVSRKGGTGFDDHNNNTYDDLPTTAATTGPGSPIDFSKSLPNTATTTMAPDSVNSSRRTSFSVSVTGSLDDRSSVVVNGTIVTPKATIRKLRLEDNESDCELDVNTGAPASASISADVSAFSSPRRTVATSGSVVGPHHIMTELPGILNQLFHSPTAATATTTAHAPLRSPSPNKNLSFGTPGGGVGGFMSPQRAPSSPTKTSTKETVNGPYFQRNSIIMLHRSPIEVFYGIKADADADNYPVEASEIGKVTGQIHPFGGLRGDAKELWRSVRKGSPEQRLKLMLVKGVTTVGNNSSDAGKVGVQAGGHVIKNSLSDKIFDDAVVIIWACGYNTNAVPVYDTSGEIIPLRIFRGQVEIDDKGNVMAEEGYNFSSDLTPEPNPTHSETTGATASSATEATVSGPDAAINDAVATTNTTSGKTQQAKKVVGASSTASTPTCKVIPNLMGNGLGYGFKATLENGQLDGSSGRADGVAVYLKRGATLILAKVLGNKVYGDFKSWEERNIAIRKQNNVNARASLEEKEKQVAAANKTMNDIIASVNNLSGSVVNNPTAGGVARSVAVAVSEGKSAPATPAKKATITQSSENRVKAVVPAVAVSSPGTSGKHTSNNNNNAVNSQQNEVNSARPRLNSAPISNNTTTTTTTSAGVNGSKKMMPLPLNLEQSLDRLSQPRVIDTSNTLYTSGDAQKNKINTATNNNNNAGNSGKNIPVKRNNFVEVGPTSSRSGKSQSDTSTNQSGNKEYPPSPSLKNRNIVSNNDSTLPSIKSSAVVVVVGGGQGSVFTPPHSSGSVTAGSLMSSEGEYSSCSENGSMDNNKKYAPPAAPVVATAAPVGSKVIPLPGKQIKLSLPHIKSVVTNSGISSTILNNQQQAIYIYSPDKSAVANDSKKKIDPTSNNNNKGTVVVVDTSNKVVKSSPLR